MTDASGPLATLLVDARQADPAHRIDLRDPIAAHGAADRARVIASNADDLAEAFGPPGDAAT